jgi:trk system potassium uptake protein
MHVVIGGYGRVGRYLAHELEALGHTVAVIDRNPEVYEEFEGIRGLRLSGEVFDRDTLIKAGIKRADAFAACTSGDNSNIVAARVARECFDVPLVIARIFDPKRAVIYESFGIPTVSAVQWSSSRLLGMLLDPDVRCEYAFGQGEIVLVEHNAPASLDGMTVGEVERPGVLRVIAVERGSQALLLAETDPILAGDRLSLAIARDTASELRTLLGTQEEA